MFKNFFNPLVISSLVTFMGLGSVIESSPADLTGTRTSTGLLAPNNDEIHKNGAVSSILSLPYVITWTVIDNGGGDFNYFYDVTNTPLLPLSLLSDDFFIETESVGAADLTSVEVNSIPVLSLPTNFEDSTVAGVSGIVFHMESIIGIIPTLGDFTLEFDVRSSPVWGDLQHDYITSDIFPITGFVDNADFGIAPPIGTDLPGYIATPGNLIPVPEPSTYMILGSSMLLLLLVARKKKWDIKF